MKKFVRLILVVFVLISLSALPLVTAGAQAGGPSDNPFPPFELPALETVLSADGMALSNSVPPLVIVVDPNPERQGIQVPAEPALQAVMDGPQAASVAFQITYSAAGSHDPWGAACLEYPAAAKAAFNKGAAIWAATLSSPVPVKISACWSNFGSPYILGYSGGQMLYRDFSGAPKPHTWYQSSLANSLHGSKIGSETYDDYITYNSGFSWYFGIDGHPPAGTYDLVSVAAHEIGHGLNFSGSAAYSGGTGGYGYSGYPTIYDSFMENAAGQKLTSFANPSVAIGSLYTSGNLWFNGANAKAANSGSRVRIYAPASWSGGSSFSHLDYNTFAGTANSMMVYAIASASSQHNPGPVARGLLRDLGWKLNVAAPAAIAPAGTITDTTPTYTFTKVPGATQYQYQLYRGTTLRYTQTVPAAACGVSANCVHTPTTVLIAGNYSWKVRAMSGGVWSAYSAAKAFAYKTVPTPITPTGTITDTTPTFTFSKIFGASQYQYLLNKGTTRIYTLNVLAASCGSTTNCVQTPATVLTAGTYTWRVRALIGGTWFAYSTVKTFMIP